MPMTSAATPAFQQRPRAADAAARKRVYDMLAVNVKRLLIGLESRGVLDEDSTPEMRKHAVRIATQYFADRVGGLFDAFRDVEPRMRMRMVVEMRENQPIMVENGAGAADLYKAGIDRDCAISALLHLFGADADDLTEGGV